MPRPWYIYALLGLQVQKLMEQLYHTIKVMTTKMV